jgi:hypothetical protein
MADKSKMKKQMLEEENKQWTEKYWFLESKNSIICMICKQILSIPKECNLRLHFEINHFDFNQKYSKVFWRIQKTKSFSSSGTERSTKYF